MPLCLLRRSSDARSGVSSDTRHGIPTRLRTRGIGEMRRDRSPPTVELSLSGRDARYGQRQRPRTDGVWNGCQHASWFFLPGTACTSSGRAHRTQDRSRTGAVRGLALPYWNWQTNRAFRGLPPGEPSPSAGGGANPLFIRNRVAVNAGTAMLPAVVNSTAASATIPFSGGPRGHLASAAA